MLSAFSQPEWRSRRDCPGRRAVPALPGWWQACAGLPIPSDRGAYPNVAARHLNVELSLRQICENLISDAPSMVITTTRGGFSGKKAIDDQLTAICTRRWLFTPATCPHCFEKASVVGADVAILDLEDAVAPSDKDRARTTALDYLRSGKVDGFTRTPQRYSTA